MKTKALLRLLRWTSAIVLLAMPIAAAQQFSMADALASLSGTLGVRSVPSMSNGELSGCGLQFEHLQQDATYLQGRYIRTSGTIGLMAANGSVGFVMKAVAADIDPGQSELTPKTLTVSRVYVIGNNFETNFGSLVASHQADTPGGVFSIFQLDPGATMVLNAFTDNKITVAIAVNGGNSDIQLPLELDVVDVKADGTRTRSDETALSFFECTKQLMSPLSSVE